MSTIIVCGGRSYGIMPPDYGPEQRTQLMKEALRERERLTFILDAAVQRLGLRYLAVGDATGADALAAAWAERRGMPFKVWAAGWDAHGKAAGPIRNQLMLDESKPDFVIAFPGSKGTRNMCGLAEKTGVTVHRIDWA